MFAERFTRSLDAHAREIAAARGGRPVLWGGDFNQALFGREYVGTRAGRDALTSAFNGLGLRAATADAAGGLGGMTAIDHLAVPDAWWAELKVPGGRLSRVHNPCPKSTSR